MKVFSQSVPLIFNYRLTGEFQSCHVTGRYYSMLYNLVKDIFLDLLCILKIMWNFLKICLKLRIISNFLTFRFHTLMGTYRFLCSDWTYYDPGRLYGEKRGMNALVHQPIVSTLNLLFYWSTSSCVMPPVFYPRDHSPKILGASQLWIEGGRWVFFDNLLFTLTQRAMFQSPIFKYISRSNWNIASIN